MYVGMKPPSTPLTCISQKNVAGALPLNSMFQLAQILYQSLVM